jgi:2-octaprenyl-6-methoxyphenol hydroxylase
MSEPDYDILIVGGGLAGMSLALGLAGSSLRVALVDAVEYDTRLAAGAGDRALALAKGSMVLLERLGVWCAALPYATPIRHIHVSDRGHPGKVRLHAARERVDALGWVITARDLEREALTALQGTAVECIVPARVVGMQAGVEGICVNLSRDGKSEQLTARLLVGADGGDSSVRRLLEIGQRENDYGQVAITAVVQPEIDPDGTAFERFTPEGPLAVLPVEDGGAAVVWTRAPEQAERLMAVSEAQFIRELQTAFGQWLGELRLKAPRRKFPLKLIRAERLAAERAVLIGNAAHQLHPVAGQGYNLGLRDAARLAEVLLEIHGRGGDVGEGGMLEKFATEREREHARVIGMTNFLATWFSTGSAPAVLLRNAGLAFVERLPFAKRALARQAMGLNWRGA